MSERVSDVHAQNVVDNLHLLRSITGDEQGAQRLAWTERWSDARQFLKACLAELPVRVETDEAGNIWAYLEGARSETVVIGSHLDSVPDGGWLDGAFGVMAALEVLRALSRGERPSYTVALVDWADEEGARFGRSLFGSSAVTGTLDVEGARYLVDSRGEHLPSVLGAFGVNLDGIAAAQNRLDGVIAYFEAHIEQGPVLEKAGLAVGAVLGTVGVERHRVTFHGRSAHSGSTPMDRRQDPFLAAAATSLAVRDAAVRHKGVGTVGYTSITPGIVTAVGEEAVILVDQRHLGSDGLLAMYTEAHGASLRFAEEEGCTVHWEPVLQVRPQPFDGELVRMAVKACLEVSGQGMTLASGALHDATEMAERVPTAMIFTSSTEGISHNRDEDTPEADLRAGVDALYHLVKAWLARSESPAD